MSYAQGRTGFCHRAPSPPSASGTEITLWQDRAELEGEIGWWPQIEEALKQVKFVVIVLTPAALKSELAGCDRRVARGTGPPAPQSLSGAIT
jgi:hypothetical protein